MSGTHSACAPKGERFTVSYDGRTLFSATDKTFAEAGGVALWTKADSVTRFDQVTIKPSAMIKSDQLSSGRKPMTSIATERQTSAARPR